MAPLDRGQTRRARTTGAHVARLLASMVAAVELSIAGLTARIEAVTGRLRHVALTRSTRPVCLLAAAVARLQFLVRTRSARTRVALALAHVHLTGEGTTTLLAARRALGLHLGAAQPIGALAAVAMSLGALQEAWRARAGMAD